MEKVQTQPLSVEHRAWSTDCTAWHMIHSETQAFLHTTSDTWKSQRATKWLCFSHIIIIHLESSSSEDWAGRCIVSGKVQLSQSQSVANKLSSHTWLRTLEGDLQPLNFGLNSAWKYTQDQEHWKHPVKIATLQLGACSWQWW